MSEKERGKISLSIEGRLKVAGVGSASPTYEEARLRIDNDEDQWLTPAGIVILTITNKNLNAETIRMTHVEAGLVYDRLGLIIGRDGGQKSSEEDEVEYDYGQTTAELLSKVQEPWVKEVRREVLERHTLGCVKNASGLWICTGSGHVLPSAPIENKADLPTLMQDNLALTAGLRDSYQELIEALESSRNALAQMIDGQKGQLEFDLDDRESDEATKMWTEDNSKGVDN